MEEKVKQAIPIELSWMAKKLKQSGHTAYANAVVLSMMSSNPKGIAVSDYTVLGKKWRVYHGDNFKLTFCEDHSYNCFFSKTTGLNIRFGREVEEDVEWCALGPEILDLEVSVNGCVPVPGSTNCKYCYKNNTNAKPTNMSFETFKQIVDSFPKNLSQIAFGITGLKTNPDLEKMFAYCREVGIIPNVTTVGADMDEHMKDVISEITCIM